MNEREIQIKIHGRVQGVGFRYSLAEKARALQVRGWCANKHDGTVECVAQGNEDTLQQLIKWCQKGPRFANVKELTVEWRMPGEPHYSFEIQ